MACSTAAGPAFEGAKISCGMRGAEGAVDHVFQTDGQISYHVIGDVPPKGLCGSGLLDLIAVLLETGEIDEMGRLEHGDYRLCENVVLTQKDVREVQLAKAAIRAGIELMAKHLDVEIASISHGAPGRCLRQLLRPRLCLPHRHDSAPAGGENPAHRQCRPERAPSCAA